MACNSISCEWTWEMRNDIGDIIDSGFSEKLKDLDHPSPDHGEAMHLGIMRTDSRGNRSWAYVVDGRFPKFFSDAFGYDVCKVPKKFKNEYDKVSK